MSANKAKTLLLENTGDTGKQMIVAAAVGRQDLRQSPQGSEIEAELPNGWTHQRTNEHHVAAAFRAHHSEEPSELGKCDPAMWITGHAVRLRPAAQGEEDNAPAALADRVGYGEGKAAATANNCERTFVLRCGLR
jgi:hypothetical protein